MSNRGWSRKRLRGRPHSTFRDHQRLFIELLEPRCVLSSAPFAVLYSIAADPVVAEPRDSTQTAVRMRLETTSVADAPLDSVRVGDYFQVKAFVQDLRTAPEKPDGVFAAYLDLLYDPELVRPTEMISYGSTYSVARNFDFCRGGLDEVGAASHSIRPLGDHEQFLFDVVFQAIAAGSVDFQAEPADQPGSDILVYNSNFPVPGERVEYVGAQINVRPSAYASAADDVASTAIDQDTLDLLEAAKTTACSPESALTAENKIPTKRIPAPQVDLAPRITLARDRYYSLQLQPTINADGADRTSFSRTALFNEEGGVRWLSSSSSFTTTEFVPGLVAINEVHYASFAAADFLLGALRTPATLVVSTSDIARAGRISFAFDESGDGFGDLVRGDARGLILPAVLGIEGIPVSRTQDIGPRSSVEKTAELVQQTIRSRLIQQPLPQFQPRQSIPANVSRRSVQEPHEQERGELLEEGDVIGLATLPR